MDFYSLCKTATSLSGQCRSKKKINIRNKKAGKKERK